ncbi:MAG: ATP-dependent zinc protease [Pseudomonadaceae bacterium]|nr:ATP-dependent zinc protease [Pseudomonadaceae bacterium]
MSETLPEIGWREWLALPDLGIDAIKAKIDTGARTSALHAFEVQPSADGRIVRFAMHPEQRATDTVIWCESAVVDRRVVRDSGGHEEERFVIATQVALGGACYACEVTLTDRDSMGFRMLLGRTALAGRYVVNSARSYCLSEAPK